VATSIVAPKTAVTTYGGMASRRRLAWREGVSQRRGDGVTKARQKKRRGGCSAAWGGRRKRQQLAWRTCGDIGGEKMKAVAATGYWRRMLASGSSGDIGSWRRWLKRRGGEHGGYSLC